MKFNRSFTIKVVAVFPPVPSRVFDWHAYVDGHEEEGNLCGYGSSAPQAVRELLEILTARIDEEESCNSK